MVVWVQDGCKCILVITWVTGGCHFPASLESIVPHMASLGEDQKSKFEVRFLLNAYCSHTTIKSKNNKSNHRKLGTICILKFC